MCRANPLWGAPRIHGELLNLGIEISEAAVAKYMVKRRGPPSEGWRAFLLNHAKEMIALACFTIPTAMFKVLFVLVVLSPGSRRHLREIVSSAGEGTQDHGGSDGSAVALAESLR